MPKNPIIPYNPDLKERTRELRKNQTWGEKTLWRAIPRKQLGFEFHRQVPIDQFIVDFYCHELMLVIEVDGAVHNSEKSQVKDLERQSRIENFGITFLRFTDEDILHRIQSVLKKIEKWIEKNTSPSVPLPT